MSASRKALPLQPVSNHTKFQVFLGLAALMLLVGIILTPSLGKQLAGIKVILTNPSRIDFDSFYWTLEFGPPFVQAGLALLSALLVLFLTGTDLLGPQMAAIAMMVGFSFYGKNILNMWFPIAGVLLYGLLMNKKLSTVSTLALYATCTGPVFSTLVFGMPQLGPGSFQAWLLGALLSVAIGVLTGFFADYFPKLHHGYLLYNAGLSATWAVVLVYSLLKVSGLPLEKPEYTDAYTTGHNTLFALLLFVLFLYLIIVGVCLKGIPRFTKLFWYDSPGSGHMEQFGFGACLVEMGVVGIFGILYVLLVGGDFNGTVFTCIWAAAGFAAFGSTLRTQLPLILGVAIGAFLTGGLSAVAGDGSFVAGAFAKLGSRGMVLSALFTCGVAPIVGNYGFLAGLLVGLVHSVLVPNIGVLHGWMSLYNNGFCLGLITILLYPLYSRLSLGKVVK